MEQETGSETIQRFLSGYDLGRKLRFLRLRKKIALTDLGKHTGLSPSMLSQLENGKMIPTLPTLSRIAMVFDVGLDHFFGGRGHGSISVVRAGERLRFPERADSPVPTYFFECLAYSTQGKGLQAYLAEFPPRETPSADHFHEGVEFIHVMEGSLEIRYDGEPHLLNEGDSTYFESREPHGYRGASPAITKALVITVPAR